jgi:hypothetical protein
VGRITFTLRKNEVSDEIDGYDFEAVTRFDNLFTGIAVERPKSWDPTDLTGTEDIRAEDTLDAEYSRILQRAYNGRNQSKRVSPTPTVTSESGFGGVPSGNRTPLVFRLPQ